MGDVTRDDAVSRGMALLGKIERARAAARGAGDPGADNIGGEAYSVVRDLIEVSDARSEGPIAVVVIGSGTAIDMGAIASAVGAVPGISLVETFRPPARRASERSATSARPSAAGAAEGQGEATARKRAEEPDVPIEHWQIADDQIAALPWDPEWVRSMLPAFVNENRGHSSKRWIVSLRAWLRALDGQAEHTKAT